MRIAALAAAVLLGPAVEAEPRATGEEMPPLASPNAMLDDLELPLEVMTIFAPEDFAAAIASTDALDLVAEVHDVSQAGPTPDVMVAFVGSWDRALQVAFSLDNRTLGMRYQAAKDAGFALDYTVEMTETGPLHIYTIAQDMAPYEIPTLCWARLIVASLYMGDQPAPFTLLACTESLSGG
ncbi:MAG: hypothetical protein AAGL89_07575 [Pseudomonadota bacterium]